MKKTAPKEVEAALPKSEALVASELRYRRLFETAKDGILILDAETGIVVDVNPFLLDLLDYPYENFVGKTIWELGFFKDIVANQDHFAELQQKEYIRYEDKPLEDSNGRRHEVEFISNVYRVNNQKVIQCNIRDITKRKQLEEAHTRLVMAVEQAVETIVITDADAKILYANPAFEKTTGYTCKEAIGQNPRVLKSGKQDADFYRQMWVLLSSGNVWSGRFINKRKDGTLYEEEASISPVRDATGKVVNYVAVKRDVTHEVQLEEQLRQAQKMEAVGRLAGGVAHDFNNMLQVILGRTEIVINKTAPDSPIADGLQEIQKAALRSAALTRQLLAFARKQDIAPEILNLNDAVAGMLKMIQRLISEDIKLVWRPGADLHPVKLDPAQIDQLLANLCLNARDAIAGVGIITLETGNVTIDAEYCAGRAEAVPGEYVFLAVSDNGYGMDRETLAHIFEPFFTTKDASKGTGLGLATVYGIVKQNNGFIYAYSEPGHGTTFRIYLPQVETEALEAAVENPVEVFAGRGKTILLVEDEPSLRTVYNLFLDGLGYNILTTKTSEEALKLAELHPGDIHLLLTDVVMPGMNGRQLAEKILAIKPDMRVLFMSGYTADIIAQRGVIENDAAFIAKPFMRDEIARKVHEVLEARRR